MKVRVTFKDPDGVYESIKAAVEESLEHTAGLDAHEREELQEIRTEEVNLALQRWIEYSEYVRIEFDTNTGTATVLPVR